MMLHTAVVQAVCKVDNACALLDNSTHWCKRKAQCPVQGTSARPLVHAENNAVHLPGLIPVQSCVKAVVQKGR